MDEHEKKLGVQEPPQDLVIFNRRQPDGTFRPLSQFFDRIDNPTPVDAGQGDNPPLQIGKIEQLTTASSSDAFTNAALAKGVKVTVAPVITPERLEAMQSELDTLRAENAKLRAALDNAHGELDNLNIPRVTAKDTFTLLGRLEFVRSMCPIQWQTLANAMADRMKR